MALQLCDPAALSDPHVDMVLLGPDSAAHMRQTLRALELGLLNDDELAWMRRDSTSVVRD